MAYDPTQILTTKGATYTFYSQGSAQNFAITHVTPHSMSFTPMQKVKVAVPDHRGGVFAVTDEGLQREPWELSISGKFLDPGESAVSSLRVILDALRDNGSLSGWTSTNPCTGGGIFMADFTIEYEVAPGSTVHTFAFGAIYVETYSLQEAEGGMEFSLTIRGVEQIAYTKA